MPDDPSYDLVIVGAGPTGLYASYYAGFRGLSTALVDALPEPGGQVTAMYPEKLIFDVAGFRAVRGRDLVAGLVEQADQWSPSYLLGRQARDLVDDPADDGSLRMTMADGSAVRTRAVLITAGIGEFSPRPLPAAGDWLGRGLVHFVPRLAEHAGRDVVVVGGGDSAFDWVLSLHPVVRSITLVHRRAKFRAHAGTIDQVRALGVEVLTDTEVVALRGDGHVEHVDLRGKDGAERTLPAQTVVAALGFTADLGPIESWGLQVARRSVCVDTRMRTTRPGVYAAGDVTDYDGKVKLIATGFGEAATAVNNIAVALDPEAHLFPGHSSDV